MSLINDMLRELDRRGVESPLPPALSRTIAAPPRRRRQRVSLLLVVLLLAAFGVWLSERRLAPAAPAIAALAAQSSTAARIVATESALPQPEAAQSEPAAVLPAAPAAGGPPTDDAQHEVSGSAAVAPGPSPSRQPAPAGPAAPARVPRIFATEPARLAGAPLPSVPVPDAKPAGSVASSEVGSSSPSDVAAPGAGGDATGPVSSLAPLPPADLVQRLSVRRHRDSPGVSGPEVSHLVQQASAALDADRGDEARQLLQQVLDRAPAQHQARLSLAALLADRGRVDDAIALLEAGLVLAPQQAALAERLGRLHLLQGEPARAAAILAQALPPLAEQPSHHALLALAWHQAGHPAAAAQIYQSLLHQDERVGPWWLGLASARDALGERAAARLAFAQALRRGGLDDDVLRYVRQRISEIEASSP